MNRAAQSARQCAPDGAQAVSAGYVMTRQSNRRTGQGQRRAAQTTRGLASLKLRHWVVLLGAGVAVIGVALLLLGSSAPTATTIKVGDCFNVPNSKDVTGVLPQSCAQ